ncbi:hypothetical protein ACTOV4_00620 [Brucella sp. C7-11G]
MPEIRTIYYKADNKPYELAAIDANRALREHSKEWSAEPWPKAAQQKADDDAAAKAKAEAEAKAKAEADAKAKAEAEAKAAQNKS